jgi:hypothetical protein
MILAAPKHFGVCFKLIVFALGTREQERKSAQKAFSFFAAASGDVGHVCALPREREKEMRNAFDYVIRGEGASSFVLSAIT